MLTEISPENERYLEHAVAAGVFHDRSQALNIAVELLKRREQLIRDVNRGIEQLDHGLGKPLDLEAIMEAIELRTAAKQEREP
jgi:Arc/MetJ-type ribon-helix-helix transcriptional regulator